MSAKNETVLVSVCFLSALVLAVSFAFPLSTHATYLDDDGRPAGWLGQLLPDQNSDRVLSYEYFWEDINWLVPLVFFLPVVLVALRQWGPPRFRMVLTVATPLLAAGLLVPLVAMVELADLSVFPGTGSERAYGGYVALGALGCFLIATGLLAVATCFRSITGEPKKSKHRVNPTVFCS